MRRRYRFVNWALVLLDDEPDAPERTWAMRCAALDDADEECGQESGPRTDPDDARQWAWEHWQEHREHVRFSESITRHWSMGINGPEG